MIHVVPQQVPVQLGTTININGNPIMAYQHAPLNMTAVGYGEPQMGHSLGAEDVMGGPSFRFESSGRITRSRIR